MITVTIRSGYRYDADSGEFVPEGFLVQIYARPEAGLAIELARIEGSGDAALAEAEAAVWIRRSLLGAPECNHG